MIRGDFDRIFKRILDEYTEIHYPYGKIDTIWRAVKDYNASAFADAVDDIIGNHDRRKAAPGKALILGYLKKASERENARQRSASAAIGPADASRFSRWCKGCANTGLVHAYSRKHPQAASFVFLCKCEAGKQRKEAFPAWDKEKYGNRYEVELTEEPVTWREPWNFRIPEGGLQLIARIMNIGDMDGEASHAYR